MKEVVLNEIKEGLNWKERIIVDINKKIFIKVYHKTRIEILNMLIK